MSLMIDIFVALLLISAIGYGMVLNRRIVALRRDKADLEKLANSFDRATKRAESSVGILKKMAEDSSNILNEGIHEAKRIKEDLNFLVERGDKLGDRLEGSIRRTESGGSQNRNTMRAQRALDTGEPVDKHVSPLRAQKISGKRTGNTEVADPEIVASKIVESEVERKFIKALRAVR